MINLEIARGFVELGRIYLVVVEEDIHGVGKELWMKVYEGFELLGTTAVGIPSDISKNISDYFWQEITDKEFQAWKVLNKVIE